MSQLNTNTIREEDNLRGILGLAVLAVVPVLLVMLAMAKSPGMRDADAFEHAQLARQFSARPGLTTGALRPLALALLPENTRHVDAVTPPAHPLLLGWVFSLTGPSETVAAAVGVGLWVVTAWLVFWVASRWWNRLVGVMAAAFFVCGLGGLMAATVGLPHPLLALLVLGAMAAAVSKRSDLTEREGAVAIWLLLLAGVLCGAAALTDYRLLPLAVVLGIYLGRTRQPWKLAVTLFAVGWLLAMLPWLIRNWSVSGRMFGLYWYSALENTVKYPGESIWRLTEAPAHPLLHLLAHPLNMARKLAAGVTQYRQAGLVMLEPVTLFLSAVAVFAAPAGSPRRRLVWLAVGSAGLTVLMSCATRPDGRLLLAWVPVLSCVAAAQLVAWAQANVDKFQLGKKRWLSARVMRGLTYAAVVAAAAFPMLMQLGRSQAPAKADAAVWAAVAKQRLPEKGVLVSDIPAVAAWRFNRPALLLCQREADLERLANQEGSLAGIYLSPALRARSEREWADWWPWVATSRGVYRGTTVVVNDGLPGLLRVPRPSAPSESLAKLEAVARQNPQSAEAKAQLALGYLGRGRLQEASLLFKEAQQLDETSIEALFGLWQTQAQLYQPESALRLEQLLAQVRRQERSGELFLKEAADYFEQAAQQQPGNPWLLTNLLTSRARLGQWAEAEAALARLARFVPANIPPRFILADLYLQQGEYAKASAECEPLTRNHPTLPYIRFLAGRAWLAQDKLDAALPEFNAAIKLRPQLLAPRLLAGQACQRLKRYDEAAEHFKAALQLSPNLPALNLNLANTCALQGKNAEAITLYRQVLAAEPKHPEALNNLAVHLCETGNAAEALPIARQAVGFHPQNPHIRDTAGWVSHHAGNPADAVLHLREAIRLDPKGGLYHYHLAKVLIAQNLRAEATDALRNALNNSLPERERQEADRLLLK